tara:strand:- start:889 stop:1485 length:597 start_codon:yes stop_codon:yes gene_type:complete
MLNKLIFLVFVTLGLTVIVLCILKSTKIEEHYIMNSEYSDVILPCEENEIKNSYSVKDVLIVLKKYNVESEDLRLIKSKLLEKGSNKKICKRALLLILDTYLIYYKPIIDSVINDLNIDNNDQDQNIEPNNEKIENNISNKQDKMKEDDLLSYDELNINEDSVNCKEIRSFISKLETDGFITKKNKNEIINFYDYNKC